MAHANKPSVDLEGGQSAPIRRRPSTLAARQPRSKTKTIPEATGAPSPALSTSPTWSRPSPFLDTPNNGDEWSTLPPSPPLPPIKLEPASPRYATRSQVAYPTPPASQPGSAKLASGFGIEDVSVVVEGGKGETQGLKPWTDSTQPSDSTRVKRRPSFIITSAPNPDEVQGLAINLDLSHSVPSPRLGSGRRSYPGESTTPVHSPAFPPSPYLSTSPVNSPTLGSFPGFLSSGSPTLPSSSAMERAPSSPRLASITDPLGRLATATSGLVRRASNNALNTDLPTSINRSPSPGPGRQPPSPTGSTPSLSPNLGGSEWVGRRSSFASQAREKVKEKELEIKLRDDKKKAAAFHNRMFSWAERPSDLIQRSKTGKSEKRHLLIAGVVVVGLLCTLLLTRSGGGSKTAGATARASKPTTTVGARLQRPRLGEGGASFIHPEVVERRKPPSSSWIGAPWRWLRRQLEEEQEEAPIRRRSSPGREARSRGNDVKAKPKKKKKRMFSIAPHVAYSEHQALPPPPVHSDAPERDTLVLYRILGNDLPPRHSPGQTLRNLRFLLQYESDFSILPPLGPHAVHHAHAYGSGSGAKKAHSAMGGLRVDKYFVLNRIAEPEMISAIVGLLHLYGVPNSRILTIPFEWSEYQRREFRWDGGVDVSPGWGIGSGPYEGDGLDRWAPPDAGDVIDGKIISEEESAAAKKRHEERRALARLRALDFTYHEKNLYAMNNNGGRNFALHHGRSLSNARWILPLDGNSFFTPVAMYSIVRTLSIAGEGSTASRYLIIPMARLLDNDDVRRNNSIALIPKDDSHEGGSASEDAHANHRPEAAPETPEEPQIGFRYDSTESFQEAMRYGRRSKLELLWRLGAILYERGLDRRTLPWEFADRHHITRDSWGSIPGVQGADTASDVHSSFDHKDRAKGGWVETNPTRGPLSFARAGWVYRLFSGHKSQEQHNSQAITLRSVNRIKGIIAFLERLDDKIARGTEGCQQSEAANQCGFASARLWNFELNAVERLRQKYRIGRRDAQEKVDLYERLIRPTFNSVKSMEGDSERVLGVDAQKAATDATLLAMAGYITGNSTYSAAASHLIGTRFVKATPLYYRQNDQREQLRQRSAEAVEEELESLAESIIPENGNGYVFPPTPLEPGQGPTWNADIGARVSRTDVPKLPFDPLNFDPSFLLDAVRLLAHSNAPEHDMSALASRKAITPLLISHLSYLLYAPPAVAICRHPDSPEQGAAYDAKIASLAAFLDDARLLGRIANRARLRLPSSLRSHEGLMDSAPDVREVHWRLVNGLAHSRFRPYSLAVDDLGIGRWMGSMHGLETPLDVLAI